jgi:hypothetical protein
MEFNYDPSEAFANNDDERDSEDFDHECAFCTVLYDAPLTACPSCGCVMKTSDYPNGVVPPKCSPEHLEKDHPYNPYHDCLLQGCTFIDQGNYRDEHTYVVVFYIPEGEFLIRNRCEFNPDTDKLNATGTLEGAYQSLERLETGERLLGQFN